MGAEQKTDSPFDLLLEELTKTSFGNTAANSTPEKTDFKFDSLLKSNNKRKADRFNATGQIEIYNEDGSLLSNAVLRNISQTGLAVEMYPVDIDPLTTVYVNVASKGGNFGKLQAKVQWVKPVADHPSNHKQMGINITEADEELKTKYAAFVKMLATVKR